MNQASEYVMSSPTLTERALEFASKYDMTPMDALHVAAAALAEVSEFVTLEKPTKPMCKVEEIRVVSIHAEVDSHL